MEPDELKLTIESLQLKLEDLVKKTEKKAKSDFWINLFSAIILPVAIAASGYWFTEALKKNELLQSETLKKKELQQAAEQQSAQLKVSLANQRLEIFKFLIPLVDIMTNGEKKKQTYVRHVISVVMPEEEPLLLQIAAESNDHNAGGIQKTLDSTQVTLVKNLFSADEQTRKDNADKIMISWYKVDTIIPVIINYANQHLDNGNGVYNSIIVLNNMHGRVLKVHKKEVQDFVNTVISLKNMPKTVAAAANFAQELKSL